MPHPAVFRGVAQKLRLRLPSSSSQPAVPRPFIAGLIRRTEVGGWCIVARLSWTNRKYAWIAVFARINNVVCGKRTLRTNFEKSVVHPPKRDARRCTARASIVEALPRPPGVLLSHACLHNLPAGNNQTAKKNSRNTPPKIASDHERWLM